MAATAQTGRVGHNGATLAGMNSSSPFESLEPASTLRAPSPTQVAQAGGEVEPELLRPAPRDVRRVRGKGQGCVLLFILPHTLAGLFMLAWAIHVSLTLLLGQTVQARVTNYTSHRGSKGSMTYHVEYLYNWHDGPHTASAQVNASEYRSVPVGALMPVRIMPFTPGLGSVPQLPGFSPGKKLGFHWLFALFWNGIVGVFWLIIFVLPRRERALVQRGLAVRGQVIEKERVTSNKRPAWKVRYAFLPFNQTVPQEGRYTVPLAQADELEVGDWLSVLHDAGNPRRSVPYRLAQWEVV